ncbi:MAG: hypothetical protein N2170_04565, partial [Bacteroidia bacterium]|nr:hypothetical protein [Bacteroidia bacterium]
GGGYIALSTGGLPPTLTLLTAAGLGGVELTPLGENMNGCNNTSVSNCIPSGPDRIQRGAAAGGEGGVLYGIAWSPYSPCPLAELSLLSWTLRPLPNRQVRHTWQLTSAFPLRNILIRMVEKRGSAISEASFFPSLTGEGIQPLLPGEYEALFYAQVEGGQLQLLERRPFRYEGLLLWQEGGNLYLTSPQDTEFVLFDTAGHLLAKGYVKEGETQVLPLEQFPTGFYYLQVGMETYRLPIQTK